MISDNDLAARVEASPNLKKLKKDLSEEVRFRADNSFSFDPMLIIMVISIVVQVIIHCREKRDDEEITQDMRDIRTLPPRKLMRLRRRLNALWRNSCDDRQRAVIGDVNPLLTAVYEVGENLDAATIRELMLLADE